MKVLPITIPIVFLFVSSFGIWTDPVKDTDSLQICLKKYNDKPEKVDVLLNLAEDYCWSNPELSEQFAKQALGISINLGYTKGKAYSNYYMARVFQHYEYDLSEKFILESLEMAKKIGDSILMAKLYNITGNIKGLSGDYAKSMDYYNLSLGIYQRNNLDSLAAGIYNNLGMANSSMGNDSLVLYYYFKAVDINIKTKNNRWLSTNYLNIGYELLEHNSLDSSLEYLSKSLKIAVDNNYIRLLPWIFNAKSEYYSSIQKYENAKQLAKKAYGIAKNMRNLGQQYHSLFNMENIYRETEVYDSAYYYSHLLLQLADTIHLHEKSKELDLLEIRYKYEKDIELMDLKYQNQKISFSLVIMGLVLVIIVLYFLQRLKIRKEQFENTRLEYEKQMLVRENELKSRELTSNMVHIANKNQLINKIINTLTNSDLSFNKENQKHINQIVSELKMNQNTNIWNAFEKEFTRVHPDFFKKLTEHHPSLTHYEIRMCAFLKMNMSTKEISEILHLNISSVQKARTRLRKKLSITGTEIKISSFLANY
jgi:DNA-binding CsgD family transcriptional regulator